MEDIRETNYAYGGWPPDSEIAEFLAARDNSRPTINEGVKNPNDKIEALLFGADNSKPPGEESLNNDWYHDVLFAHTFLQKGAINPNWILLNKVSSIDVFSNPQILIDIHKSEQSIKIH